MHSLAVGLLVVGNHFRPQCMLQCTRHRLAQYSCSCLEPIEFRYQCLCFSPHLAPPLWCHSLQCDIWKKNERKQMLKPIESFARNRTVATAEVCGNIFSSTHPFRMSICSYRRRSLAHFRTIEWRSEVVVILVAGSLVAVDFDRIHFVAHRYHYHYHCHYFHCWNHYFHYYFDLEVLNHFRRSSMHLVVANMYCLTLHSYIPRILLQRLSENDFQPQIIIFKWNVWLNVYLKNLGCADTAWSKSADILPINVQRARYFRK